MLVLNDILDSVRHTAIFDVTQVLIKDDRVPYDVIEKVRLMMESTESRWANLLNVR